MDRREGIESALAHVLANAGAKTAGGDGLSRTHLKTDEQPAELVTALQADLKSGAYPPKPVKRVWIPKPGKTEKRGLGIPTIRDRVVQELLRMRMEPIGESDFLDGSHGFRPGRRTRDGGSVFYSRVQTNNQYVWAIEGDIRKGFDRIHHSILLGLIQQRIADRRIVALIEAFRTAGIRDGALFQDTPEGTPQGGILSPLLANIYLHQLDRCGWRKFGGLTKGEKWPRRRLGLGNARLVRYADDVGILWTGTHAGALALRAELKQFLWNELRRELSDEKTRVTHLTEGLDFLGYPIQWELPTDGHKPWLRVTPTKENLQRFRNTIQTLTQRDTTFSTPEMRFKALNRVIRGWGHAYRHVSFSQDANKLDYWLNQRVLIWLDNKHDGKSVRGRLRPYKKREVTKRHDRWNFVVEGSNGELICIAKLTDIRLTAYRRKRPPHP